GLVLRQDLTLNPREFSAAVRPKTSALFQAAKTGGWEVIDEGEGVRFPSVEVDGAAVELFGNQFSLVERVEAEGDEAATVLGSGCFVVLDKLVSAELEAEGWARDLIRQIQDTRKAEGLHIADRINVTLTVPEDRLEALGVHEDLIKHETLTIDLAASAGDEQTLTISKR
ncbi:MAG: isoleucine--tRNA ligase, partial [Actinomyces sp.]|nr:isoleucine--tRNA ligase [Actinomyces sp.]